MGWLSKTFKKIKGAVKDVGKLHEKVFKGVFVDPIKKAWKSKPLRYAMIGAAALAGGAMLAPMLAGSGTALAGSGTALAGGTLGGVPVAGGIGGVFPGMSLAGSGATALAGGAGMSLGQAAALQLGGGLLSGGAQALEGRRQEKMLERERDNRTVAGVRYQGGTAEDRISVGDPLAGLETPPARQQQQQQQPGGGMLSQAIMPSRDERVPYYLRGQTA